METVNNTQAKPAESQTAVEDIVSRVSKPVESNNNQQQLPVDSKLSELETKVNEAFIKPEEWSSIKDPLARQILKKKESEMLSGLNKKFQEIAELRKSYESKINEQPKQTVQQLPDITTREGLLKAIQDPKVASLVQELYQEQAPKEWQGTGEEWSALNASEKAEWKSMKFHINNLSNTISNLELERIDSRIKSRFADYDSNKISSFEKELEFGKVDDEKRRELIYKALNYENAINRAYNIAKEEFSGNIKEKVAASSLNGLPNSQSQSSVIPERGNKSSSQHFIEIARKKIEEAKLKGAK